MVRQEGTQSLEGFETCFFEDVARAFARGQEGTQSLEGFETFTRNNWCEIPVFGQEGTQSLEGFETYLGPRLCGGKGQVRKAHNPWKGLKPPSWTRARIPGILVRKAHNPWKGLKLIHFINLGFLN